MNDIINPDVIGRAVMYAVWLTMAVSVVLSGISCFTDLEDGRRTPGGNDRKRTV